MSGEVTRIWTEAEKHPYVAGGLVLAAVLVGLYFSSGSGGGGGSTSAAQPYNPSADPNLLNAELQTQAQQAALTAHSNDLSTTVTAQLQGLQIQGANEQALATIQAHTAELGLNYQYQLGAANLQVQSYQDELQAAVATKSIDTQGAVQMAQIASGNTIAALNAETAINITQLNDALQGQVALYTTQLQTQIANDQTKVALAQTNAAVKIAQGQQTTSLFGAGIGLLGKIL